MPPKHDDIEAGETKRATVSNADIIPDAGKVHLGKCTTVVDDDGGGGGPFTHFFDNSSVIANSHSLLYSLP